MAKRALALLSQARMNARFRFTQFSLRALLAFVLVISVCCGLLAWDVTKGAILSSVFVSLTVVAWGYKTNRRGLLLAGLIASSVAMATLILAQTVPIAHSYESGTYLLTVQLKQSTVGIDRVSYTGFFSRELAEVIEQTPGYDGSFFLPDSKKDFSFQARIHFSIRTGGGTIWREDPYMYTQQRYLVLVLSMSDGGKQRLIVDVPSLENTDPRDRQIVVEVDPVAE